MLVIDQQHINMRLISTSVTKTVIIFINTSLSFETK